MKLIKIIIGLLLTVWIGYDLHSDPRWNWNSPGIGKLPRDVVNEYLDLAYDQGKGEEAAKKYFSPKIKDYNPASTDRKDGAPIKHQIKRVIADGMNVAIIHQIDATRGAPEMTAIDIYKLGRDGQIVDRVRFIQAPGTKSAPVNAPAGTDKRA